MSIPYGPILIVEDVPNVLELLEVTLRFKGYPVITARNGQEALERIVQERPAMIITDILMPRKGGLMTISELRKERPDLKIIAMSGGGRTGKLNFLSTAKTFPGVLTLHKPFRQSEVLEAVKTLLSQP